MHMAPPIHAEKQTPPPGGFFLCPEFRERAAEAERQLATMSDEKSMMDINRLRGDYVRKVSAINNEWRENLFAALATAYATNQEGELDYWARKAAKERLVKKYDGSDVAGPQSELVTGLVLMLSLAGALPRFKTGNAEPPSPYLWFGVAYREHLFETANRIKDLPKSDLCYHKANELEY